VKGYESPEPLADGPDHPPAADALRATWPTRARTVSVIVFHRLARHINESTLKYSSGGRQRVRGLLVGVLGDQVARLGIEPREPGFRRGPS